MMSLLIAGRSELEFGLIAKARGCGDAIGRRSLKKASSERIRTHTHTEFRSPLPARRVRWGSDVSTWPSPALSLGRAANMAAT
jgi:hypothetical protein